MRDLFPASRQDGKEPYIAEPGEVEKRVKLGKELPPPQKKSYGKLTKVYQYTDEHGKALFEVCRYESEENGKRKKTFIQRTYDPTNKDAKTYGEHQGYVLKTSDVRHPLYRLHEVVAAVTTGKTIYLVEGEKDADNLCALGLVATTNPGGASKAGQRTKWLDEHTETLRGADVVILPDIDETGVADRQKVARKLVPVCKSVKLLDITKAGIELPEKGDVSDLLELAGKEKTLALIAELEANTAPLNDEDLAEDTAYQDAVEAISSVPGFAVENGCICKWGQDGNHTPLCSFVAAPEAEIVRDDGLTQETIMLINGWTSDGRRLPQVRTSSKNFKSLGWVMDSWGFRGNIRAGNTVADNLRYVIGEVGRKYARQYTEYTHTGWRKIDGKWAFLYQGGAIGAEHVSVDLGSGLQRYRLDGDGDPSFDDITLDDALTMSYQLTDRIAKHVSIPLLGLMYLAPLKEQMDMLGCGPSFALFLVGESGTGKSTAAALALSHFGYFTAKTPPASFNDTANYVQKKAFLLKDVPILVDDYHPTTSLHERRRMEATAQSLSRTFGDNATRNRMNSDTSLREATPPRSVSIISGEYTPDIGESGVARYYIVRVEEEDVPKDDALTIAQDCARRGYLRKAMRGYIEWLLPQMDTIGDKLNERFQVLRRNAPTKMQGKTHPRAPETVACLMIGYEMFLEFAVESGLGSREWADSEIKEAWGVITSNSTKQAEEAVEERPSRAFITVLGELLTAHVLAVRDLCDTKQSVDPTRGMVGYKDDDYYYLLADIAYKEVAKHVREKGQELSLTQRSLYRQMRNDGLISPPNGCPTYTAPKRVPNGDVGGGTVSKRMLWIPCRVIDGEEPKQMQMKIPIGTTLVPNKDMPF